MTWWWPPRTSDRSRPPAGREGRLEAAGLSASFVIPRGTQVVLRRDISVAGPPAGPGGERTIRKHGSVGEVIESPLTNEYSYSIRFADGSIVRARKADLAIRR